MKKLIILLLLTALSACLLIAQTKPANPAPVQQPDKGFKGVQSYVEKTELVVEVKSLIPTTDVFQDKSDTYIPSGDYKFTYNLDQLRKNSDILLNKWLKESK